MRTFKSNKLKNPKKRGFSQTQILGDMQLINMSFPRLNGKPIRNTLVAKGSFLHVIEFLRIISFGFLKVVKIEETNVNIHNKFKPFSYKKHL